MNPDYILEGIRMNIEQFALPNMLFRHHGGGIEHLTTIPATINEMLMQSHEGIIRLFPCWKKTDNVSFENLRADGAFLVSSELKDGIITSLKIKSLAGRKCVVECENINSVIRASDRKKIKFRRENGFVEFKTETDIEYILI